MRNLLGVAIIIPLIAAFAGCGSEYYRGNMRVVPDRAGHAATNPDNPNNTVITQKTSPGPDEMYITLSADDRLYSVAKAYGVTLEWLIKRNDLAQDYKVQAGNNLIVPKNPPAPRTRAAPTAPARPMAPPPPAKR